MVFIVVLLVAFVDYEVLFRNHNTNSTVEVTISDIFRSVEEGFGRYVLIVYCNVMSLENSDYNNVRKTSTIHVKHHVCLSILKIKEPLYYYYYV